MYIHTWQRPAWCSLPAGHRTPHAGPSPYFPRPNGAWFPPQSFQICTAHPKPIPDSTYPQTRYKACVNSGSWYSTYNVPVQQYLDLQCPSTMNFKGVDNFIGK